MRYEPEYFGKKGFTSPQSIKRIVKAINVGELEENIEKFQPKEEEGKIFVDLEKFGITKLLGTGKVTKPLVVKVTSCSRSAAEKIKEAGGQVLVESMEESEE